MMNNPAPKRLCFASGCGTIIDIRAADSPSPGVAQALIVNHGDAPLLIVNIKKILR
jgi:hypothetical protein